MVILHSQIKNVTWKTIGSAFNSLYPLFRDMANQPLEIPSSHRKKIRAEITAIITSQ